MEHIKVLLFVTKIQMLRKLSLSLSNHSTIDTTWISRFIAEQIKVDQTVMASKTITLERVTVDDICSWKVQNTTAFNFGLCT